MMATPFFITLNFSSQCAEISGPAPNAHAADVFAKAKAALATAVDNEAVEGRLPCSCHWGLARITPELSKGFEDQMRTMMRTRKAKS